MRTSKPIATISWNTPSFFEGVCGELYDARKISFWAYICHKGEDDEGGKKDHIHAYIEPSRTLQTLELRDLYMEPDKEHNKPLGCLDFRPSKFSDWYFYALHDVTYLAGKAMTRKYHYSPDNIRCSDEREMQYRVGSIEYTAPAVEKLKRFAVAGKTWRDVVLSGGVTAGNFHNLEQIWGVLLDAIDQGILKCENPANSRFVPSSQQTGLADFRTGKTADLPFVGDIPTYPLFPLGSSDKYEDDTLVNQDDLPPSLRD